MIFGMEKDNLVSRLKDGEEHAWAETYKGLAPLIRGMGYKQGFSSEDIEEIVQDTMISAYKGIKTFRGNSKVSTWVVGIALNNYRKMTRNNAYKAAKTTVYDEFMESAGKNTDGYQMRKLDAGRELAEIERILLRRAPKTYNSIILRGFGYMIREVSEITKVPLGTASSRVRTGLRELRKRMPLQFPYSESF